MGLDAQHPFAKPIREGTGAKGIFVTEHGPAMLVVAPVLDGAGNGPHRGAVLLARVITPEVAARLAEQAQVDLKVTTTSPLSPSVTQPPPPREVFGNETSPFVRSMTMAPNHDDPSRATLNARLSRCGISSAVSACTLHLTSGLAIATRS